MHFLHATAKEQTASPSPSITSRLFAKTAGMPSQTFSRHSPPVHPELRRVTRHFRKLPTLSCPERRRVRSFAPERKPSPSFSIRCALSLCLPGMPPTALSDLATRHSPLATFRLRSCIGAQRRLALVRDATVWPARLCAWSPA